MLKQSSSRNHRSQSLKARNALKIFVLLAVSMWFLYQVKKSYCKEEAAIEERPSKARENEYMTLKMGRKDLKPGVDKFAAKNEERREEEEEEELEDDESKLRETENTEKREEAERDQLQDLVDDDDRLDNR